MRLISYFLWTMYRYYSHVPLLQPVLIIDTYFYFYCYRNVFPFVFNCSQTYKRSHQCRDSRNKFPTYRRLFFPEINIISVQYPISRRSNMHVCSVNMVECTGTLTINVKKSYIILQERQVFCSKLCPLLTPL